MKLLLRAFWAFVKPKRPTVEVVSSVEAGKKWVAIKALKARRLSKWFCLFSFSRRGFGWSLNPPHHPPQHQKKLTFFKIAWVIYERVCSAPPSCTILWLLIVRDFFPTFSFFTNGKSLNIARAVADSIQIYASFPDQTSICRFFKLPKFLNIFLAFNNTFSFFSPKWNLILAHSITDALIFLLVVC